MICVVVDGKLRWAEFLRFVIARFMGFSGGRRRGGQVFWLGARFKVFAVQEWLIWFFKLHLDCSGLGLSFGSFFLLLLIS